MYLDTASVFSRIASKSKVQTMAKVHSEAMTIKNLTLNYSVIKADLFFDTSSVSALLKVLT